MAFSSMDQELSIHDKSLYSAIAVVVLAIGIVSLIHWRKRFRRRKWFDIRGDAQKSPMIPAANVKSKDKAEGGTLCDFFFIIEEIFLLHTEETMLCTLPAFISWLFENKINSMSMLSVAHLLSSFY